jgi:hypothetical protein
MGSASGDADKRAAVRFCGACDGDETGDEDGDDADEAAISSRV